MSAAPALQHSTKLSNAAGNFNVQRNGKAFLILVTLAGVEPATCGLGNRRSIHLSYRATLIILTRNISSRRLPQARLLLRPRMRPVIDFHHVSNR